MLIEHCTGISAVTVLILLKLDFFFRFSRVLKFSLLAAKAGNVTSMDFALENQNSQRRDELLELSVRKG